MQAAHDGKIHIMSTQQILKFLFPENPYFGGATLGIQGEHVRHVFMSAAIALKATESASLELLEVGSWTGASTLTWCEAIDTYCRELGGVLCVDPWAPYVNQVEPEQEIGYRIMMQMADLDIAYDLFQHNVRFTPPGVQVNHMRGKSSDILPYLKSDSFDIMFIDGDHSYEAALYDIRSAKRLVKIGGFICGDDLEVQGSECDPLFVKNNISIDCVLIPELNRHFHPGVTLAVQEEFGEVSAYHGFWVMRKTSNETFEKVALLDQNSFIPSHFSDKEKETVRQSLAKLGLTN